MANIQKELAAIMSAYYGEEVRGSIHDAISKINDVTEKTLTLGTSVTEPTSSVEGYFEDSVYININTYDVWRCTGSAWAFEGTLKGEKGDKGEQGNRWFRGTDVSGKSVTPKSFNIQAAVGDMYVNVTEQSIYHCTESGNPSKWSYDFTMAAGGGGSVDIDGVTITENASGEIQVSEEITKKLPSTAPSKQLKGKVPVIQNDGSVEWGDVQGGGGISPDDMLNSIDAVEQNTTAGKVVDALVVKEYANRYTNSVISTLTANQNEITIASDVFKNDNATFEFMFEPNANNEVLTLAKYELDTTAGTIKITVVTAPTINTRIRVDVTDYRA